jgi:hypothetical protein
MNEPHDPNRTVDGPSAPADALDAGLAAGFAAPRSSLGDLRPVLLKEAEGESGHVVQLQSDAMPTPEQTGDRYQLSGEIARGAWARCCDDAIAAEIGRTAGAVCQKRCLLGIPTFRDRRRHEGRA